MYNEKILMLPKKHRIAKKSFEDIFKRGKNYFSDYISLKVCPIPENRSIFTFVVSSKVAKKAVERNKLKRRSRYIVKKILDKAKKGRGVIVFFKKDSNKLNFYDLEREIIAILEKAKILDN